jgi:hypothetical protein
VLQEAWDANHSAPPSLFGQQFMLTQAGSHYGLPALYALHAWIWKANPSGTFSPYNPQVACRVPLGVRANNQEAASSGAAGHQRRDAYPLATEEMPEASAEPSPSLSQAQGPRPGCVEEMCLRTPAGQGSTAPRAPVSTACAGSRASPPGAPAARPPG